MEINLTWYPLSKGDIQHFDEKGYLILPQVIENDTVGKLLEVGDRLMASDLLEGRQSEDGGRYDSL